MEELDVLRPFKKKKRVSNKQELRFVSTTCICDLKKAVTAMTNTGQII